jgi:hypothetical protein
MRKPNPLPTTLALLACAFAFASSAALATDAVYKWKDANGQSHYSQSPPPSGTKYETISPVSGPSPAAVADAAARSDKAPATTSTSFKPAEVATSNSSKALREKNCATAKANVATLSNYPYANLDTKGTGQPAPTNADQRAAEVARANQMVTQYCGGN